MDLPGAGVTENAARDCETREPAISVIVRGPVAAPDSIVTVIGNVESVPPGAIVADKPEPLKTTAVTLLK